MTVSLFDNPNGTDEAPYLRWLSEHPGGLVVNLRRRPDPAYAVLHRATCWTITRPTLRTEGGPFTSRAYIKACATDEAALRASIMARQGAGFSKRCAVCGPA